MQREMERQRNKKGEKERKYRKTGRYDMEVYRKTKFRQTSRKERIMQEKQKKERKKETKKERKKNRS